MYLLVDNFDSFTYNLYALFKSQGAEVDIVKNTQFIDADKYEGIILSPGPSSPEQSGTTLDYIKRYLGEKPIFGVCLGMQCLGYEQGYPIKKAATVKHGKIDGIEIVRESVLFRGLPKNFNSVRYHSLAVDVSDETVTAISASDGTVMAMEDPEKKYFGVQFHPESFMSESGEIIVKNFLEFVKDRASRNMVNAPKADEILRNVITGGKPDLVHAHVLFDAMAGGELTEAQIAAALVAIRTRGETVDELTALVSVLNSRKKRFGLQIKGGIDTCGTGGDGKSTVNVSTAVSFILASLGYPVVKHGNRAQSGTVGSADILEQLGLDLNYISDKPEDFFKKHNYIFMMAPHYHPALKTIGKVRRELKVPTIFNFVGPLVNPADPDFQVIGISRREKLEFIADVLEQLGRTGVTVYSSQDGYDEISSRDLTDCISLTKNGREKFTIRPADFFEPFDMPVVDTKEDALNLFLTGLSGENENISKLFALNAALAINTMDKGSLSEGYNQALDEIKSGKVIKKLKEITGENLS